MSRYSYALDTVSSTSNKIIGLFPFNAIVDPNTTNVHEGKIDFLTSAVEGLEKLAAKKYSVVLFINQFKNRSLSYEQFQPLNQAVEKFIRDRGLNVIGVYWCPVTNKNDPFVVPNPGMFNKVTENTGISFNEIPVISSSENDLLAASKVKATPIKIGNGPSKWAHYETLFEFVINMN
jgi:histidinol phosphatase-like enzyme